MAVLGMAPSQDRPTMRGIAHGHEYRVDERAGEIHPRPFLFGSWNLRFVWRLEFGIWSFLSLFLLGLLLPAVSYSAEPSREYQIKAVFLYNFAQFTDWPTNAFENKNSPLVICTLGTNPFGDYLQETVRNEIIRGRSLQVEHHQKVEEIKSCHILYVGESEADHLEHILRVLKGKPVLIVSDIDDSAARGVMIRFTKKANKIRLRINLEEVRAANLNVSSKLLQAAELVPPDKK
jgi:hypothetical protein